MSREVAIIENVLPRQRRAGRHDPPRTLLAPYLYRKPDRGARLWQDGLLEKTLEKLAGEMRLAVMVGDLTTGAMPTA